MINIFCNIKLMNKLFFCFLLLIFFSCENKKFKVDVSKIDIKKVEVLRLDKDLFESEPNTIGNKTNEMVKKYGGFYPLFVTRIINSGGILDSSYLFNLNHFLNDRDMKEAYLECKKNYSDLTFLEPPLTDAFKHLKYYFPTAVIPSVVAYMSGFNYSISTDDSTLGIGLEMYLGNDSKFYQMLQFPKYKTLNMGKANILPDGVRGWLLNNFENKSSKADFLSEIIYNGKIYYLMDALLPEVHDSLKIGYTLQQLDWCKKQEYSMWTYILEQKMLYSNNMNDLIKFTREAPFTAAFGNESPPRTGNWIGWQIVKQYMNHHSDVSLQQLMDEPDAQKIFTQSKYKPNK